MKKVLKFLTDNECNIKIISLEKNAFKIEVSKGIFYEEIAISSMASSILIDHLLMAMIDRLNQQLNASNKLI